MKLKVDEIFDLGLKRKIRGFKYDHETSLELGGNSGMTSYRRNQPHWDAETEDISFPDNHLSCVMCFHFLEHIKNIEHVMREIERVLMPGGKFLCAVPYYKSQLAFQDPDHKRFFTEETFEFFCEDRGYKNWDNKTWSFKIYSQWIAGVSEKNLMLFTILEKQ